MFCSQHTALRPRAGARCSQHVVLSRPHVPQPQLRVLKALRPVARKSQRDSTNVQQTVNHAATMIAALAVLISPLEVAVAPAVAAGEEPPGMAASITTAVAMTKAGASSTPHNWEGVPKGTGTGTGRQIEQQSAQQINEAEPSKDPGWGRPSPLPHPPVSPPQTPAPGRPSQPTLPPGPPGLLPHKPPAGPNTQQPPTPQLPQLPDVPPQLLPPCPPSPDPPQLLPPCPQPRAPPPIVPTQASPSRISQDSKNSNALGPDTSGAVPAAAGNTAPGARGLSSAMEAGGAAGLGLDRSVTRSSPSALAVTSGPDSAANSMGVSRVIDAAFDAALGGLPAVPSTLQQPQEMPSSNLDGRGDMSINLDAQPPAVNPTSKAPAAQPARPTTQGRDVGGSVSRGSTPSSVSGVGLQSDAGDGSITLNQVLTTTGQLALQLLEAVVRVAAFVIKYTLKAFIWLVKLLGQWASAG